MPTSQPSPALVRATGRLPTFLIVGAPKAGTTSLSEYLGAHPQAYLAPLKELYFFNVKYELGVDWYRMQFRRAGNAVAVGEATPTYMYRDHAMSRMAELLPDVKLIATLRNPVDRLYSDYWHMVQFGETRTFEEVVRQERRDGGTHLGRIGYLDAGRYLGHLQRICVHYPRESLLVVLMDDLKSQPNETFADVCRFLGIDENIRPKVVGRAMNRANRFRSPWLRKTMLRFQIESRAPWLSKRIERLNRSPFNYPKMDPSLRAELVASYAEDNAALATWIGRDLSAWSS